MEYFSQYESGISFVVEKKPLGTAGALGNAKELLSTTFFVLNGDTLMPVDYKHVLSFHRSKHADITIVLAKMSGKGMGRVTLKDDLIISFIEKGDDSSICLTNAGVYVMEPSVLDHVSVGKKCSLEYELFPFLIENSYKVAGYVSEERPTDIGTPESYFFLSRNKNLLEL